MVRYIKITCDTASMMPIDDLESFQGKLKSITEAEFEKLKAAILKYGFSFPVFVWRKSILDGHQRVQAVKRLIDDGYELEGGMLPVALIEAKDRKEAAEKLLLINSRYATIEQDGFDWFVQDFDIDVVDMSGLLEIPEVDFSFEDEEFEGNTDPDDVPEVEETPVTQIGDIWLLGEHRLCCGDSTKIEDVEKLMNGKRAGLIFYDPPFEMENIYSFIPECKNNQRLIVFGNMFHFSAPIIEAHNKSWVPNYELIWDCVTSWYTPNRPLARHKKCYVFGDNPEWNFETAIIRDGKKRESKTVTNNRGELNYIPLNGAVHLRSIEAFPTTSESGGHAHSKPVKWIAAILNGIDEQIIFDMFSGSGTTIIAAHQTGRKCYAMEISPQYVDVAIKRWQDFTGEDAILESTGQTFTQVSENAL